VILVNSDNARWSSWSVHHRSDTLRETGDARVEGQILEKTQGLLFHMGLKFFALILVAGAGGLAQEVPADYQGVLQTLGKQGDFKDNVLKLNIPRNGIKVSIDGIATPTPFGFGGWLAIGESR
jgi:hypothetical protein